MRSFPWCLALSGSLIGAAVTPVRAQDLPAKVRAAVADTIRQQADRVIAAIASKQIDRFMALFTTDPDLTYVDNGKIYPSREALATAAGGFFKRIGKAGGTWESPRVVVLSATGGAFTGIFRPVMEDLEGKPLWTSGKIWTFVYQRRAGKWVIVQAHEVNALPAK